MIWGTRSQRPFAKQVETPPTAYEMAYATTLPALEDRDTVAGSFFADRDHAETQPVSGRDPVQWAVTHADDRPGESRLLTPCERRISDDVGRVLRRTLMPHVERLDPNTSGQSTRSELPRTFPIHEAHVGSFTS